MKFGFKIAGIKFGIEEIGFNGKAKDDQVTKQTEVTCDLINDIHKREVEERGKKSKMNAKNEAKRLKAEYKKAKAQAKAGKKAAKAAAKAEKKAAKKAAKNRHEIPDAYKHPVEFDN